MKALSVLGCERIDHGYHVMDDLAIAYRLADVGIHFTTCPTVASRQGWWRRDGHVLRQMWEQGLWLSINSDDPAVVRTTLSREYALAARAMELSRTQMMVLADRAIDAAWMSSKSKEALHSRFRKEFNRLPTE